MPFTDESNKKLYYVTQTGLYSWIGSGHEYILDLSTNIRGFVATEKGILQNRRDGGYFTRGAVTSILGNEDFYPDCIHSEMEQYATPDGGDTWYSVKKDMKDPNDCGFQADKIAEFGIWYLKADTNKVGTTRNISLNSGGYFGGTDDDDPIAIAISGNNTNANVYVAGNYGDYASISGMTGDKTQVTFTEASVGGAVGSYTTNTSSGAQIYKFNYNSSLLRRGNLPWYFYL